MQLCDKGHIKIAFDSWASCPACVYRFASKKYETQARHFQVQIYDLKKQLTIINVYNTNKSKKVKKSI